MIKPDVIVTWPRNCDYPIWRQFIHDNRTRFNVVMVVFMETNQGEDYRQFVRLAMAKDWVLFADSPEPRGRDWRDVAVNHALIQSYNAPWVWFTEQDFMVENPDEFFSNLDAVERLGLEWSAVYDSTRMHPCCIFVKRTLLEKIKRDFSASPPAHDHFGAIQKQLEQHKGNIIETGYKHMNGLSQNMTLLFNGELPNYKPEEFREYVAKSLEVSVPLNMKYVHLIKSYLEE